MGFPNIHVIPVACHSTSEMVKRFVREVARKG
jgi:hypothetical protein